VVERLKRSSDVAVRMGCCVVYAARPVLRRGFERMGSPFRGSISAEWAVCVASVGPARARLALAGADAGPRSLSHSQQRATDQATKTYHGTRASWSDLLRGLHQNGLRESAPGCPNEAGPRAEPSCLSSPNRSSGRLQPELTAAAQDVLRAALARNDEWQQLGIREVNRGALLDARDKDVGPVINPWSEFEFQIPPRSRARASKKDPGVLT
jgi:hypothetical protein